MRTVCREDGFPLRRIGATIGGTQLYGCTRCGLVYFEDLEAPVEVEIAPGIYQLEERDSGKLESSLKP